MIKTWTTMGSLAAVEAVAVSMLFYGCALFSKVCILWWMLVTRVELGVCRCTAGGIMYRWAWWY